MPKKKNVKKILIIVVILFALILGVRELALNAIERAKLENKTYTSISDFTSVKEIAKYMGCTYIKEEPSTGEKYDIDIYLKFKYPLYTDEVSNEDYYYKMIALMLEYLNYQNIRLIDQENDIVIAVECDKEKKEIENLLINGEDNYFGTQENLKQIQKYQQLNVSELEIQAQEIKDLISSNWITSQVNFGTPESTFNNYDIYFDEGIEIKTVSKKVFNIVFTEKYSNPVVNGIKVNTSFDEIKNILGEPTFNGNVESTSGKYDNAYIGYKGKEIYIFFSENEISIYRNEKADMSTDFEDLLKNFNDNLNSLEFVNKITDIWPDYDYYYYSDNTIDLRYTLRGIEITFTDNAANGVNVYNNYNGYIANDKTIEQLTKSNEGWPNNVYLKSGINLIENNERMRKGNYYVYYNQKHPLVNLVNYSNIFNLIPDEEDNNIVSVKITSKNREYPSVELNLNAQNIIWYKESILLYNIENKGIYAYDVVNRKNTVLVEAGTNQYVIKALDGDQLFYDETVLFLDSLL